MKAAVMLAAILKLIGLARAQAPVVQRDDTTISNGIPAFWFQRGIEPNAQANLWRPFSQSVWVNRAIKIISGPVSAVDLRLFAAADALAPRAHNNRTEIELPQLRAFLRQPIARHSYADFVEATIGWTKLQECFWVLSDAALLPFPEQRAFGPQPIIIPRPDQMREVVDSGELVGWVWTGESGQSVNLLPDQVIQIGGWNPYNKWRRLGELEAARIAVEADWLAGRFSRNLSANNGDTGPFIIAKGSAPPTDTQREQIVMDLRHKRRAQLRGDFSPVFLTGDIEVQDPKISAVDAAFISQRLENRHEIAIAFGVPPSMFDVKAAYSIGSASDAFQLISNTCVPAGAKFCGALDTLIRRLFGIEVQCELDWSEHPVMQQVRNERFDAMAKLADRGMPMREISDYLGLDLPAFPGWEIGHLPINVSPAGETAEVSAADEPVEPAADFDQTPDASPEAADDAEDTTTAALIACESLRAATGDARAKEWLAHYRHRRATMGLFRRAFRFALSVAKSDTLHRISAAYRPRAVAPAEVLISHRAGAADLVFDLSQFRASLTAALRKVEAQALTRAGQQLLHELKSDDVYSMPPAKVAVFLKDRQNKISGVPDEVHRRIKTALQQGYDDGDTTKQLASRISAEFSGIDQGRGSVIAQTETAAAYGYARQDAMTQRGVRYKKWLTSGADNVRPAHRDAQGQIVRTTEAFDVGGELLEFPGDPEGSAANTINCHCVAIAVANPGDPNA